MDAGASTAIVELVPVEEDVLRALLQVAVDDAAPEEVMATAPGPPGWTDARREAFRAYHRGTRAPRGGREVTYAVRREAEVVGAARLVTDAEPGTLEVGLWLARSRRGQGIARAVLPELCRRAGELGARRLVARTRASNGAALSALRGYGFTLVDASAGTVVGTRRL